MPSNHRAFTLLELVVALGVIAILLAIAVPAVQSSRESARNVQCQNHLRQILLGCQSFHATKKALPSLYNGTSLKYPLDEWDLFHTHSWRVPLLPHLEQSSLRQRVDWDALATEKANESVAQTVVPTYVCPSGADPAGGMGWGLHHASISVPEDAIREIDKYYVVRSDYDAIAGIQVLPDELPDELPEKADPTWPRYIRWGIWGWPRFDPLIGNGSISGSRLISYRAGRFRDVTDGLSNTIAVVERGGKPIHLINGKPAGPLGDPSSDYPGQHGWSASNTFLWSVNIEGVGINEDNASGIYSVHPGGANVAMADGSVRFLSDSTDDETLVKMFSRSAGPGH